MSVDPALINKVRLKTTLDTVVLPDSQIAQFLLDDELDTDLAIADSLEFLAAQTPYKTVSRGGISVSNSTYMDRAAVYRRRANLALDDGIRRNEIESAKMTRTDVGPVDSTEFAFPDV